MLSVSRIGQLDELNVNMLKIITPISYMLDGGTDIFSATAFDLQFFFVCVGKGRCINFQLAFPTTVNL